MKPGAVQYLATDIIYSRSLFLLKVKELERGFIYLLYADWKNKRKYATWYYSRADLQT